MLRKLFKQAVFLLSMQKAYIWILVILVTALIFTLGSVIFYLSSDVGFSSVSLAECKILEQNSENGIDIVFFGKEKDAERYMDYFLNFDPFDDFKERFNFYYIDNYKAECEIYKGIALLCYSRELLKKAGSCPNDFIAVLEDSEASLRSSSYVNVMSINLRHPMSVLTHEFGHVFANLAEEYTPAKIPRGALNCPAGCSEFEGRENGCFVGCSENEKIRSIENGIMRTLRADDFGNFNDWIFVNRINEESSAERDGGTNAERGGDGARGAEEGGNEKDFGEGLDINSAPQFDTLIVGRVVDESRVDCSGERYYLIEGRIVNGRMEILRRNVQEGCVGGNGYGGFSYQIVLEDGEIIGEERFNPELIFTSAPGEDEIDGGVFDSDRNFFLRVPIVENSDELEILLEEELLAEVDLYDIGGRACLVE